MYLRVCLLLALCTTSPAHPEDPPAPALDGIVTAVISTNQFEIDGRPVQLTPATSLTIRRADTNSSAPVIQPQPRLGLHLQVFGPTHAHIVTAQSVIVFIEQPLDVTARGVVGLVTPSGPTQSFRAGGYLVTTAPNALVRFQAPLATPTALRPNLYAAFHGTLQPDGTVLADKAVFFEYQLSKYEKKFSERTEYDPTSVDPDYQQTALTKFFLGTNPKKIPPYEDHQMQQRISSIGEKLIPQYQRDLPVGDPTRINFRFQLVDESHWASPLSLASGIVLVPFQLVDRLQNDSQIAALLADSMAMLLEGQAIDLQTHASGLVILGGVAAAEALIPGVGLGVSVVSVPLGISANRAARARLEERSRIILYLLHDAGYDPLEAPKTLWLLNGKKKDFRDNSLPARSTYLYRLLGSTWHETAPPPGPASSPAAPSPPAPSTRSTPSAAHAASPPRSSAGSSG